jgi:exodeoxyribonuclease V gamma subunit
MTLHLHRSNRTERLVDALVEVLAAPTDDPFAGDAVVVHSKGLERWLQHQLAERLGICAHVAFPFPQELVAQVTPTPPWTREALEWALLAALPTALGDPALTPLRAWLAADPHAGDRRRIELCRQLAALFDRYAWYRPELVATWADPGADPGWEPVLWRAVEALRPARPPPAPAALPHRLVFFSVGTLPPATVRVLADLAREREVHVLLLAPSVAFSAALHARRGAWVTLGRMPTPDELGVEPRHPLLASLGTLTRDFQVSLEAAAPTTTDRFEEPATTTVLGALQADLLHDRWPPTPSALAPDDHSLRFHAAHGPARQVQVLRDQLLWLLDTVPGLEPRDIVVMAPDLEAFAPLVQATFSDGAQDWSRATSHPGGLPRIPFRLADRPWERENRVAQVLLKVLALADTRLCASEGLDLAELGPVQRRFGLSPEDLPTLRTWVAESGIRWAADAEHRAAEGQPADDRYTWRFGLDRLLLGAAAADDREWAGQVPLPGFEGRDERATLGGFVDLAETLLEVRRELDHPRSPSAWRTTLSSVVDRFASVDDDDAWQRRQVEHTLAELAAAPDHGFTGTLDRSGLVAWLSERFGVTDPGQGFLAGGVTFCQLVPMRAIPFRVVCLLGMDDGGFPRTGARLGFDRMALAPRLGDRSVRDDDRALFLEALLSARDHLLVFYTGRDPRDDRSRPPAVPVAELLDVLDASLTTATGATPRDALTTHHPLQPFAARAFDGSTPAWDRRMLAAARTVRDGPRPPPPFLPEPLPATPLPAELPLAELDRFFRAPFQWFFTRRLGAWAPEEEDGVVDREPLDLDRGLDTWALTDHVLRQGLAGADLRPGGVVWRRLLRSASLPLGMPGEQALLGVLRDVQALLDASADHRAPPPRTAEVHLGVGGTTLTARLPIRGERLVKVHVSNVFGKHRFSAWLTHLVAAAAGLRCEGHLFGSGGGHVGWRPVDRCEANALLERLVALFEEGQRLPLMWFPDSALLWTWGGLDRVRKSWGGWGDPEPWARRVLGDRCPFDVAVDLSDLPIPAGLEAWVLADELWTPANAHELGEAP